MVRSVVRNHTRREQLTGSGLGWVANCQACLAGQSGWVSEAALLLLLTGTVQVMFIGGGVAFWRECALR